MSYGKRISANTVTYEISGNFDYNLIMNLKPDILDLPVDINNICLDLSNTKYLDSSGLGLIVFCREHLENSRGKLTLQKPTGDVKNILELSNIHKIIEIIY